METAWRHDEWREFDPDVREAAAVVPRSTLKASTCLPPVRIDCKPARSSMLGRSWQRSSRKAVRPTIVRAGRLEHVRQRGGEVADDGALPADRRTGHHMRSGADQMLATEATPWSVTWV